MPPDIGPDDDIDDPKISEPGGRLGVFVEEDGVNPESLIWPLMFSDGLGLDGLADSDPAGVEDTELNPKSGLRSLLFPPAAAAAARRPWRGGRGQVQRHHPRPQVLRHGCSCLSGGWSSTCVYPHSGTS